MALLVNFIYVTDQLVKYFAATKDLADSSFTVSNIAARKGELRELWAAVKVAHEQCVCSPPDKENPLDMSIIDAKFRCSNETYIACLALLLDHEKNLKIQPAPKPSNSSSEEQKTTSHCIAVPPCDSESFKGDCLSWPSFRDMFDAVYGQHPKLNDVQKLFHLIAKTEEEAHSIVAKFPLTNSSFKLAWEALRTTFENTRLLVNNQLKVLLNLPVLQEETTTSIKTLQRCINDCLAVLETQNIKTQGWDPIIVYACSTRLPATTLALWEQSIKTPSEHPTWEELNTFLTARYKVLESVADVTSASTPQLSKQQTLAKPQTHSKYSHKPVGSYLTKSNSFACQLCSGQHPFRHCPEFKKMDVRSRINFVMQANACLNCFAFNHTKANCTSLFTCNICQGKHHTMLHVNSNVNRQQIRTPNSNLPSTSTSLAEGHENSSVANRELQSTFTSHLPDSQNSSYFTRNQKQVLLATALIRIFHRGEVYTVRALIDPASEVSFISSKVQARLRLPVSPINSTISGINTSHAASSKRLCHLQLIINESPRRLLPMEAIVLQSLTNNLPARSFQPIEIQQLLNIRLADPTYYRSSQVDMLLGADVYPTVICEGIRHVSNSLVAQNTIFGWILSGPLPCEMQTFTVTVSHDHTLEQQLKKFWEIEEVSHPAAPVSEADQYCETLYHTSTIRRPDGRYEVCLPFKPDIPQQLRLGPSRHLALQQYIRNERSLARDNELHTEYKRVVSEYLTLRHMHKVTPSEVVIDNNISSFYLPHHAVLKPGSLTTKVRVVFNASSPSANGNSLNDILLPGSVLQRDLTSLILRWRFWRYVFNSDIEKMYRQIFVHPDDSTFQRILFRSSSQSVIEDYQLDTVTFGVNCAPYLALRTLTQLAKDIAPMYPLAAQILRNDFYVDDVLSGAHDIPTAKAAQIELINALNSAGFALRKWTSNEDSLLNHLPQEHLLSDSFLSISDDSFVKALGVFWNAKHDWFYFTLQPSDHAQFPTKREVLSQIARLFDPAGWLAPILITAKILMQQTWLDKTNWKSTLTPETNTQWTNFMRNLPDIKDIKVPRWIGFSPSASIQLHGFCDASEKAYAATIYLRVTHSNGGIETHLLCAKTKVAPVKQISLPRLELCGAVLLSKLIGYFSSTVLITDTPIFVWTDSSIVIAWLRKPSCTWKTFVANRVSQIVDNLGITPWRHVRSHDNPADLATRGLTPTELKDCSLWWKGPSWLSTSESEWPQSSPVPILEALLETKKIICLTSYDSYL